MADHSRLSDRADHSDSPARPAVPDYELPDQLILHASQIKLMLEPTRRRIIDLLAERAATTSQLADVLERPKGSIGHHCKALEAGGLIHVVRTAKVRAMEERYYGRTARLFIMNDLDEVGVSFAHALDDTFAEIKRAAIAPVDPAGSHLATVRYARIPVERAAEWASRLADLADEFAAQERGGDEVIGVFLSVFATDRKGFG